MDTGLIGFTKSKKDRTYVSVCCSGTLTSDDLQAFRFSNSAQAVHNVNKNHYINPENYCCQACLAKVRDMSNACTRRRKMQPDFAVGINLPISEYLQMKCSACHIWSVFIHRGTILQRPDERRWTTLKNCFADLIYCQRPTARHHFFPFCHTQTKAPLEIMHGLTDQLSWLKVRVFI